MIIIPLGVGGAFTEKFFHNNYLFQLGEKTLLVDAGTTLRYSLKAAGWSHEQVDYLFVTHFHSDHAGGVEEFLQRCYWRFEGREQRPYRPTLLMMESQEREYNCLLESGLKTDGLSLPDYCRIQVVPNRSEKSAQVTIGNYVVEMIDTTHLHCRGMQSFALKVTELATGTNILFSSDIKRLEQSGIRERTDAHTVAIFQDVQFRENGVHASLEEVAAYYPSHLHERIYAMHVPDDVDAHMDRLEVHGMKLVKQGIPLSFPLDGRN